MHSLRWKSAMTILHLSAALLLCTAIGYCLGRIVAAQTMYTSAPLSLTPDTRPRVPVVRLEHVQDSYLIGRIDEDVRLFVGDEYVLPTASGTFRIPAGPLLINEVSVIIPEGMHFVASKRGKYFYPVASPQGERLSPSNRVYFRTAEEAIANGYSAP